VYVSRHDENRRCASDFVSAVMGSGTVACCLREDMRACILFYLDLIANFSVLQNYV
jgi:hypothetical protein